MGEEQRGPESHSVPPVTFAPPPPQSRASGETKVQERNGLRVQWENRLGIHVVVRVCRIHVAQQKRKYRRTIVRRPPNWMNSTQLCCPIWKISEISDVASRSLKKGRSRDCTPDCGIASFATCLRTLSRRGLPRGVSSVSAAAAKDRLPPGLKRA